MLSEKGNLSINSENIMPIIKKWLYSDADIFVRELVSNASDAITKLRKLSDMGEAPGVPEGETYRINVTLDKEQKTVCFDDNGIGMTAEEIKQYINQIAFSGASDFLNKYQDKLDKENEIIGHFGLGFYSSFMVADRVQIDSLSYAEGAEPARWVCEGGLEFELFESDRTERGTAVTLFIGEDGKDFLEEYKLRSILTKYCNFMPVEIYLDHVKTEEEIKKEEERKKEREEEREKAKKEKKDKKKEESEAEAGDETVVEPETEGDLDGGFEVPGEDGTDDIDDEDEDDGADEIVVPKPVNDIHPLWMKAANDCTDEEYKSFYHKVFSDFTDPLFWIHLNMDYPYRLKGILFFPKMKHELEYVEGQVKLYNSQVFIADNIKEVIPEFLLLLKGVIDCPDLPLNVSRSFLQNDGYAGKMSGYISRKVADKLNSIFKKERETYNGYWEDISPFIKYGCIKEKDFYEKTKDCIIYKTTEGVYKNLSEFVESNREKTGNTVYYVSNEQQQAQYMKLFKDQEMEAVVLSANIDNPFISYVESYEKDAKFSRIDSDLSDKLKDENQNENDGELQDLFRKNLGVEKLNVKTESLKSPAISAVILLSEQSRRMQEMSKMFGGNMGMFETEETLVLNNANNLVHALLSLKDREDRAEEVSMIVNHIYDLAMLSHKPLPVEQMTKFIERSNMILERLTLADSPEE